ncbi:aminotransferase class III-fold pyridoxal phosphate-dependent enzyme [Shinella daejeonensis]|uniref:aminotransferase family protein n=1 Tax=Shinella daejeonensis TaxID=659017 RepID=UPI0020C74A4D|nr:aminotransferase class III-fold pyridoxal phosphate-dependent enzyme [Shinella daejeonensis]MCP8897449.1 aminotransferase class III-fold pyridoxal phosphate-dependent enzyme [Shinella daejeonensis]
MTSNADALTNKSLEHLMFPLVPRDLLHERGPNVMVSGKGLRVVNQHGRELLDMMSTSTRAGSLGYGNEEIGEAMRRQAVEMHYAGAGLNISVPAVELAGELASLTPGRLKRVAFTSGGSEATETAIKIARHYQNQSGRKPGAWKVISRWNAYHGATLEARSCTDWLSVRDDPAPRAPGHSFVANPMCYRNPYGLDEKTYTDVCLTHLERQIKLEGPEHVAAFICEPFQQANGVQIPLLRYWQGVREICDRYGVLLILDEVITGFGRTGTWFAAEQIGIEPDILNVAKAMGAGYVPIGAVITRDEIANAIGHFRHVHTYAGHAVSCAASLKVIEIKRRDGLIERSSRLAETWQAEMSAAFGEHPAVGQIRGRGFWQAIDFTTDRETHAAPDTRMVMEIADRVRELGVIVSPIGTAIEIAPALIATETDLAQCTDALAQAIREVTPRYGIGG